MCRINSAIMGCNGIVGQQFVRMLKNHPFFRIKELIGSEKSAGKVYGEIHSRMTDVDLSDEVKRLEVRAFDPDRLLKNGIKVVFSALPTGVARDLEDQIRRLGLAVFSNASALRMDSMVPVLIPEVNQSHLQLVEKQKNQYGGFVVTNSNCTTSGLVLTLKPILRFGVRSVTVSTYQAISGGGLNGVRALDIHGNILPFIAGEEEKIVTESRKILGEWQEGSITPWNAGLYASCCRVPVRDGHLESVTVEMEDDVELHELKDAWKSFRGLPQAYGLPTAPERPLIVRTEENRPQPLADCSAGSPVRARGMAVSIGRIRKQANRIQFFLLVNNTVRGAAGTCILNAELIFSLNLFTDTGIGSD